MEHLENAHSNIFHFDPDRRRTEDPTLEQLIRGIVSSVKERERRNVELEDRNAELRSALEQAHERISRLERAAFSNRDLAEATFATVDQLLEGVEEVVRSMHSYIRVDSAAGYGEAIGRAVELHKEAISILERAREDGARRGRETGLAAIETIREVRRSIRRTAEGPEHDYLTPNPVPIHPPQRGTTDPFPGYRFGQDVGQKLPIESPPIMVVPLVELVEPRIPAQRVHLTASPFSSFDGLTTFHRSLQQLPGVMSVEAQGFDRGILSVSVEYRNSTPLAVRLLDLPQFALRLVALAEDRIEVAVVGKDN